MKKTYKIDVDCANCANKMEEAAKATDGVKDAVVNTQCASTQNLFTYSNHIINLIVYDSGFICDIFIPNASLFYPFCRKPFVLNLYMTLSAVFALEINNAFCFCAVRSFLTAKISLIYVCYFIYHYSPPSFIYFT